jgi:hypothetical protein
MHRLEHRFPSAALAGLIGLLGAPVFGEQPAPQAATAPTVGDPPQESLRAVEERGRLLADYFEAVAQAEEQVRRQSDIAPPDGAVVIKSSDGLRIVFVKDVVQGGVKKGTMEVAESAYDPTSRKAIGLSIFAPPTPAPASVISFARALQRAKEGAGGRKEAAPPFDHAVIREKDGSFSVYLRSRDADGPGGDLLALIAATGRQLVDVEALHQAVTHLPPGERKPGQATLHSHTEREGELPTATDVALIVRRPELAPHLVLTPRWMFRIDAEGRLTYLGPNPVPAPAASSAPAAPGAAPAGAPAPATPPAPGAPRGGDRP